MRKDNVNDAMKQDQEFEETTVDEVRETGDLYEVHFGAGFSFGLAKEHGVVPVPGQRACLYGKGFGFPVRGVVLDGRVAFYRTQEQEDARHAQWAADQKAQRLAAYAAKADEYAARVGALPAVFRARIDRFRRNVAGWDPEFLSYELFVCEEALKIAAACPTLEALKRFQESNGETPPGVLSGDHSGNTFGAACFLARAYIETPEYVDRIHGALCPLVGCEKYGCFASEASAPAP